MRGAFLTMDPLPVGTRIRFLRTLTAPANEEHPGRLYAVQGELGTVEGHNCREGHFVKWDGWTQAGFGALLGEEFLPAAEPPPRESAIKFLAHDTGELGPYEP